MSSIMKKKSSIKAGYQELYAAVRSGSNLHLIDALKSVRAKCGAMVTCELSEKAHKIFQKQTEIKLNEPLKARLIRYKIIKQPKAMELTDSDFKSMRRPYTLESK